MTQPHSEDPPSQTMTEAAYLAFEEQSETKHEYVAGKVIAMAGAGWNHNIINGNVQTMLNTQLAAKPCVVVSSDMRLKVTSASVSFRYPDTMVICDEPQFVEERVDTIGNPTVIIEVLSPSTALTDLNQKLDEYIQIATLQEYVIISQHETKVAVYRRHAADDWRYTSVTGSDGTLTLTSIGCTLLSKKVYDKTRDVKGR